METNCLTPLRTYRARRGGCSCFQGGGEGDIAQTVSQNLFPFHGFRRKLYDETTTDTKRSVRVIAVPSSCWYLGYFV